MSQHDAVQKQFGKTAGGYVDNSPHAVGEDLKWMTDLLPPLQSKHVLDVATGGGHAALALARAGARVTATDITPEMLTAARQFIESREDANSLQVSFAIAAAEALPFESNSWDAVTCRTAAHHFVDPVRFVREVARVLKPGGRFILIDNIATQDSECHHAMNWIEKKRDPSHVEAYRVNQWLEWMAQAQLDPHSLIRWRKRKDFASWIAVAQTPEADVEAIEAFVLTLSSRVQKYLGVQWVEGKVATLEHEAIFLMCDKAL